MARTRYASDRGLTSRMLVTMFLLGLVYVVFVGAFFVFVPEWAVVALVVAGRVMELGVPGSGAMGPAVTGPAGAGAG